MNFLVKIILASFSVLLADWLLSGIYVKDYVTSLLVAFVLAILNIILKPILVVLTIPITFLTLGLFLLVINALMVLLAGEIVPGFHIDGFWWALGFSLIVSIVNSVINSSNNANQYSQNR
jgi:putative membrane protein